MSTPDVAPDKGDTVSGARRLVLVSRGGQINGSQRQLHYLVTSIDRGRYQPHVVCRGVGPFVGMLGDAGVPAHAMALRPWRKWSQVLWRYLDARRLVGLARSLGAELLHGSDLWLSGYVLRAAAKLGVPSVLHARGLRTCGEFRKHGFARADAVIAVSQRIRRGLLDAGVADDRIAVIYDAVDLERFRVRDPADNILRREFPSARGTLVGIVGRIKQTKRQLEFLHSAARLIKAGLDATFFIVGDSHQADYLGRLRDFVAEAGLDSRLPRAAAVVFTGRRNDIDAVLASLDVLVTLSGGSVMMEALACGTPVISAGFTPPSESTIVRDGVNGLLIPPGHESELDDAIARLASDAGLREKLGRSARQHAEANYGHLRLARETQAVYDRLLGGN